MISGYDAATDTVEYGSDYLFGSDITMARVTRQVPAGRLKAVLPRAALVDPWPEEFLWCPITLLGVVDAWWSMWRAPRVDPSVLECVYQVSGGGSCVREVPRDLVEDRVAWESVQPLLFRNFLCAYQDELDRRAAELVDLSKSSTASTDAVV